MEALTKRQLLELEVGTKITYKSRDQEVLHGSNTVQGTFAGLKISQEGTSHVLISYGSQYNIISELATYGKDWIVRETR